MIEWKTGCAEERAEQSLSGEEQTAASKAMQLLLYRQRTEKDLRGKL